MLSFALVPFQGWAALKGLVRKQEGPWFRTPKTGHITDEVHHLRRLRMLRQWLLGPRETRLRPATPPPSPPVHWSSGSRRRHAGWVVAGAMAIAIALLVWGSTKAPISQAAGNPLNLHGSGAAPCAASTIDQTAGARTTACSIQSQAGGVITTWSWTALPAQTITAGVWTFTMYWTGGTGNTLDTVTINAGVVSGGGCALFVPSVPNAGTTWTTTYGGSGANATSPFVVSTSGSQAALSIPPGGSLCVQVILVHTTGGKPSLVYDGVVGTADTHVTPPSVVVPESLLPFAGLALAIPLVTGRRRLKSLAQWVTR